MKTKEEWTEEFLKLAPRWMGGEIGRYLFHGLAAALVRIQDFWELWKTLVLREFATGETLDSFANDQGLKRTDGEDDESLRARLLSLDQGCTPHFIIKEGERLARTNLDYTEPARFFADVSCFADYTRVIPSPSSGGSLFSVLITYYITTASPEAIKRLSITTQAIEKLKPASVRFYYRVKTELTFYDGLLLDIFKGGNYL